MAQVPALGGDRWFLGARDMVAQASAQITATNHLSVCTHTHKHNHGHHTLEYT